ncbi:hypothetical protein TRVL_08302 [Trypanosoma vivax]|nr:hypothetical protein TRVL_08302 [Trypanosoma vivax]
MHEEVEPASSHDEEEKADKKTLLTSFISSVHGTGGTLLPLAIVLLAGMRMTLVTASFMGPCPWPTSSFLEYLLVTQFSKNLLVRLVPYVGCASGVVRRNRFRTGANERIGRDPLLIAERSQRRLLVRELAVSKKRADL